MQLILVRHAQIQGDPFQHYTPPVDGCLSPAGCVMAQRLGEALKSWKIDAVYSSPLGRAVQTAQAIANPRQLEIGLLPWIVEWKPATLTGECEDPRDLGNRYAAAEKIHPERAWKTPAGEGTFEMAHRIVPSLLEFLANQGIEAASGGFLIKPEALEKNIAIVAHGGSLGLAASFLLGIPLRPYAPLAWSLTGVGVIEFVHRTGVWYPQLVVQPIVPLPA